MNNTEEKRIKPRLNTLRNASFFSGMLFVFSLMLLLDLIFPILIEVKLIPQLIIAVVLLSISIGLINKCNLLKKNIDKEKLW